MLYPMEATRYLQFNSPHLYVYMAYVAMVSVAMTTWKELGYRILLINNL